MKTILNIGTESLVILLCGMLIFSPQLAFAQAPVASGATKTEVTEARNGVPVVNIVPPSASGLSHNTFTSYNGDTSQQFRQSQLVGGLHRGARRQGRHYRCQSFWHHQ